MEFIKSVLSTLGTILIVAITYFLNKSKEREAEWRKEKLKFYINFTESLSGITDCEKTPENDVKFAKSCNDLYLFAPADVLSALRLFQDEIRISNTTRSPQKYYEYLSKLFLEIRKDIKVKNKDLESFQVMLWTSGVKNNK